MGSKTRASLIACALVGLGASLVSLAAQYRILQSGEGIGSLSPSLGSEALYRSHYALFQGVPVSFAASLWFVLAILLTLAASRPGSQRRTGAATYLFLTSTLAVTIVLFLNVGALYILHLVCVPCLVASAACVGIFLFSSGGQNIPLAEWPKQLADDGRTLLTRPAGLAATVLLIAAGIAGREWLRAPEVEQSTLTAIINAHQPTEFDLWFESHFRAKIDEPMQGAQVLVLEFTDYQSPVAAETYQALAPVFARYEQSAPGKVRHSVKDFPLDPECNPGVNGAVHEAACEAAAAARLARDHQKGPAMEAWLYAHAATLTPASVRDAAKTVGGVDDFDARYPQALAEIKKDIDLARQLSVRGTPTFFINGVRIEGGLEPSLLEQGIEHELKIPPANRVR